MRILFLITGLNIGGAESQLVLLAKQLVTQGCFVKVVSLTTGGHNATVLNEEGIELEDLGMRSGIPNILAIFRLFCIINDFKPTILQSWLFHSDLLATFCKVFNREIALIWSLRCSYLEEKDHGKMLFRIIKLLSLFSRMPAAIVPNSQAGMHAHQALGYKSDKWCVIPNAIDVEKFVPSIEARLSFRRELGLDADVMLVGLVARFDPMKDHENFLGAAAIVRKTITNVEFVLVGEGINENNHVLMKQIADLRLTENIHLLSARKDINKVQAAFDVAVCSSYSEGFPNVLAEAMSCGVPCVTTDVGDAAVLVQGAGVVVGIKNKQELSDGICKLLKTDCRVKQEMSEVARNIIKKNYSVEKVCGSYISLYKEVSNSI